MVLASEFGQADPILSLSYIYSHLLCIPDWSETWCLHRNANRYGNLQIIPKIGYEDQGIQLYYFRSKKVVLFLSDDSLTLQTPESSAHLILIVLLGSHSFPKEFLVPYWSVLNPLPC